MEKTGEVKDHPRVFPFQAPGSPAGGLQRHLAPSPGTAPRPRPGRPGPGLGLRALSNTAQRCQTLSIPQGVIGPAALGKPRQDFLSTAGSLALLTFCSDLRCRTP